MFVLLLIAFLILTIILLDLSDTFIFGSSNAMSCNYLKTSIMYVCIKYFLATTKIKFINKRAKRQICHSKFLRSLNKFTLYVKKIYLLYYPLPSSNLLNILCITMQSVVILENSTYLYVYYFSISYVL